MILRTQKRRVTSIERLFYCLKSETSCGQGGVGRKGQRKQPLYFQLSNINFSSSNEQSYFNSVARTWQLLFEFLKKKQNYSTIWETYLSFTIPCTYTYYVTLLAEYSHICMQSFPAEMHRDSFATARMESAVQKNCSAPIT